MFLKQRQPTGENPSNPNTGSSGGGGGGGDSNYPRVTNLQRANRTNESLTSWTPSDVYFVGESVPTAHQVLQIDSSYTQKQRPNTTTYIVRFSDQKINEGGNWSDRATLNFS